MRRILTLLFAAAELTLLAGAPAVDALLHASTRADTTTQVATLAIPDWTCGYCLLQATPGVATIPATAFARVVAARTVAPSGLTDLLYSPPVSAGHGARAPPIV